MFRAIVASLLFLPTMIGCGGGGGADADTGPCVGAQNMEWPDETNPEFCTLPVDTQSMPMALTECGVVGENCSDSGPTPNLGCLATNPTPPANPPAVTLTGFVDVFSSGPNSDNARIEVYKESQLTAGAGFDSVTPIATADVVLDPNTVLDARACPTDVEVNNGECLLPAPDTACPPMSCAKTKDADQFCFPTGNSGVCQELLRWEVRFELDNIPTHEFLVVRTVGLDDQDNPEVLGNVWAQLLQTNVYLSTTDRACEMNNVEDSDCYDATNMTYRKNVNLLSSQDYMTIPTSAGLSAGITPGNGGVAGEVHDCDGVRIQHAQLGFTAGESPRVLVYFNGNPVKTLPSLQRATLGTNALGLYAGLDMPPGPVELVGLGNTGTAIEEAGRFATRVWANSVTLVTVGGGRPQK